MTVIVEFAHVINVLKNLYTYFTYPLTHSLILEYLLDDNDMMTHRRKLITV